MNKKLFVLLVSCAVWGAIAGYATTTWGMAGGAWAVVGSLIAGIAFRNLKG